MGPFEIQIGCHDNIPVTFDGTMEITKTYPLRKDRSKIRIENKIEVVRSDNAYCNGEMKFELIYSEAKPDFEKIVRPYE